MSKGEGDDSLHQRQPSATAAPTNQPTARKQAHEGAQLALTGATKPHDNACGLARCGATGDGAPTGFADQIDVAV